MEGGREEGGKEEGKEGGLDGWREGGKEEGKKGGREGWRRESRVSARKQLFPFLINSSQSMTLVWKDCRIKMTKVMEASERLYTLLKVMTL